MASATVIVTKRNIAEREAKASRVRSYLARISNRDPRRFSLLKELEGLTQEISALKASVHYYKPPVQLGAELAVQKRRVAALRSKIARTVTGSARHAYIRQLEAELKKLKEMLAAASLKTSAHPPAQASLPTPTGPDLALVPPSGEGEEAAAMATEEGGFDFTAVDLPGAFDDGSEKPWYMHPVVLVGAGAAIIYILKK